MAEPKKVKARVLADCAFGKANEVVEVTEAEAKSHASELDTGKEAVAYAESIKPAADDQA
jgi:hypothetical protein